MKHFTEVLHNSRIALVAQAIFHFPEQRLQLGTDAQGQAGGHRIPMIIRCSRRETTGCSGCSLQGGPLPGECG